MLAGGAEAPLAPLSFGAFAIIRAMSTRNDDPGTASRPFDAERDGFVMGEGAAVLVLEERGHALARGARIYAETLRVRTHQRRPPHDGPAARRRAGGAGDAHGARRRRTSAPAEVGYVNAHGSSTPLNDSTETLAPSSRCSASTPNGWPSAAPRATTATPSERAAPSRRPSAPCASHRGWLPPTLNLTTPDPACDLDYLAAGGRAARPEYLLSNSFGFGGINAALVLRRAD